MASDTYETDDQDQSEVFDEDNTDGDAAEFKTFEELPDLLDVTSAQGDAVDSEELDEADFDEDAIEDDEFEDDDEVVATDGYEETDEEDDDLDDADGVTARSSDEAPLIYVGDVDGRRGAQASAAHFESRGELNDSDLEDLGYQDKEEIQ
jgi:hypothetical protein